MNKLISFLPKLFIAKGSKLRRAHFYYRSFKDPFDALAHKHVLDSLTKESVLHNIQQENPTLNKLNFEISNK